MSHSFKLIEIAGEEVEIDELMVKPILWLNSLEGVRTFFCCEGNDEPQDDSCGMPYIMFGCKRKNILRQILKTINYHAFDSFWIALATIEVDYWHDIRYTLRFKDKNALRTWIDEKVPNTTSLIV